jgi:hypothetical protein
MIVCFCMMAMTYTEIPTRMQVHAARTLRIYEMARPHMHTYCSCVHYMCYFIDCLALLGYSCVRASGTVMPGA